MIIRTISGLLSPSSNRDNLSRLHSLPFSAVLSTFVDTRITALPREVLPSAYAKASSKPAMIFSNAICAMFLFSVFTGQHSGLNLHEKFYLTPSPHTCQRYRGPENPPATPPQQTLPYRPSLHTTTHQTTSPKPGTASLPGKEKPTKYRWASEIFSIFVPLARMCPTCRASDYVWLLPTILHKRARRSVIHKK